MNSIKFNGVLVNEKSDSRNYNIAQFIPNEDIISDTEFMLKLPSLEIIMNQGLFGSCVGHAFALAKQIVEYQHTNKWIDVDPYALYGTRYPDEYDGIGMYPIQGAKVLKNEGVIFRYDFGVEQEMPELKHTLEKWKKENPDKVEYGKRLVISGYSQLFTTHEIKKALKNNMPIAISYPLYSSFYDVKEDGIVSIKKSSDELIGYHEMVIVGWKKGNYWIVVNSWGTENGMKGMYFIPFGYAFDTAISISDTITPSTYKAKKIELKIDDYNFVVDGVCKRFDVVPTIVNNRTMVPVRFICENLGASVEWIQENQKIIIRSEEKLIQLQAYNKKVVVNNKIKTMDTAPFIDRGRTFVPIRFIAESLNCKVTWTIDRNVIIEAK